jgi:hypothetical protein
VKRFAKGGHNEPLSTSYSTFVSINSPEISWRFGDRTTFERDIVPRKERVAERLRPDEGDVISENIWGGDEEGDETESLSEGTPPSGRRNKIHRAQAKTTMSNGQCKL